MSASAADNEVTQLTSGDFDVDAISLVDAAHRVVYYTSNEGNALEQQVWQVGFDGKRKQLTTGAGYHEANFSPNGQVFVDTWSTRMEPDRLSLCQHRRQVHDCSGRTADWGPINCERRSRWR